MVVEHAFVRHELEVQPKRLERISTGIGELDRALGGGLVAGQVVLLGDTTSAGQPASATPVQTSSGSQTSPEPVRQVVPAPVTLSAGHVCPATPVQSSSGSQRSPEPGLQTVAVEATTSAAPSSR